MWFELEIRRPYRAPIRDVFQAQTAEWAIYQAEQKYPGAIAFVMEKPPKAFLARSSDRDRKVAQRKKLKNQFESRS